MVLYTVKTGLLMLILFRYITSWQQEQTILRSSSVRCSNVKWSCAVAV